MEKYLYLLPFKDRPYFKIGISSGDLKRVLHHNKTYTIDLPNSYIITAKNTVISAFESELLSIFPSLQIDTFIGLDGHTEIRDKIYFNEAVDIIKSKHKNLGVSIHPFSELHKPKEKKVAKTIKTHTQKRIGLNKALFYNTAMRFNTSFTNLSDYIQKVEKEIGDRFVVHADKEFYDSIDSLNNFMIEVEVDDYRNNFFGVYGFSYMDKYDDHLEILFNFNVPTKYLNKQELKTLKRVISRITSFI